MTKLEFAAAFAATHHNKQKYGEDKPYTYHLGEVVKTLKEFGTTDEEMLIAAWLHDVVEDTPITVDDIKDKFGDRVADLVWRVTNESGVNRKERHAKTYPKVKGSTDALRLKLADRIANVRQSVKEQDKLLGMYRKEYKDFRGALYSSGIHEDMWLTLDGLIYGRTNG